MGVYYMPNQSINQSINFVNDLKKSSKFLKKIIYSLSPYLHLIWFYIWNPSVFLVCFCKTHNFNVKGLNASPLTIPVVPAEGCRVDFRIALCANCESNAPCICRIRGRWFRSFSFRILNVLARNFQDFPEKNYNYIGVSL